MAGERLQKLIAQAGITSRRNAEQWIKAGRVRVNGRVVTELGTRADIRRDKVEVDGRKIQLPRTWTYIIMNKPAGTVTTAKDEFDRRTRDWSAALPLRLAMSPTLELSVNGRFVRRRSSGGDATSDFDRYVLSANLTKRF